MVLWEEYLDALSGYMGVDSVSGGVIISMMFTISIVIISAIATRGRYGIATMLTAYAGLTIFTVAGWLPYWIMLIFTLLVAGLYSQVIMKWFGGGR